MTRRTPSTATLHWDEGSVQMTGSEPLYFTCFRSGSTNVSFEATTGRIAKSFGLNHIYIFLHSHWSQNSRQRRVDDASMDRRHFGGQLYKIAIIIPAYP